MAKAKAPTVELDEMPEPVANTGGDSIPSVNFEDHKDAMEQARKSGVNIDLSALDLNEDDQDDDLDFIKPINPHRFVLVRLVASPGSPWNDMTQKTNGMKAVFPKNRWVVVQYFFVINAQKSGYTDWEANKGGKHMRRVENHPVFDVKDDIPDEFNSPDKIMEFVNEVSRQRRRPLPLACDTFVYPPKQAETSEEN